MDSGSAQRLDRESIYQDIRWSRAAADYARYRAGFPEVFYARIEPWVGPRVLDVGTGTGTVARALAARGREVTGIDVSAGQLTEAARLAEVEGASIALRRAPAEDTGLPDASFDTVVAGQCWHWLDRPRAAREMRRVLRPGGRMVIAHLDWLERPGNVVAASSALIRERRQHPPPPIAHLQLCALYGPWLEDLFAAGFEAPESFSFDVLVDYSREAWRGRVRASHQVGARMDTEHLRAFDAAHAEVLEGFPEPLRVPHRIFVATAKEPS